MNLWKISGVLLAAITLAACGKGGAPEGAAQPTKAQQGAPAKAAEKPQGEKHGDHGEGSVVKLTDAQAKEAGVRTEKVSEQPIRARFSASATIQPNRDRFAHVAPRIPGRIVSVPPKAGDRVAAGQLLAELDSVELGEAHSAYLQSASHETLARSDFQRAERLYKEQVFPEKDYLRAQSEYEKARAGAQAAADKLRLMGIAPKATGGAQSRLPVTSPFAGTVIEKNAVIGELAQPDKALFTVADLSTVWIEANLSERDLSRVSRGAVADIAVQAYPEERFRGKVVYVGAMVDKDSRTVKARIEVPNKDERLKPEMFATAHIDAEAVSTGIAVESEAVVLIDGKKVVFVKEADGYESREVTLGDDVGGRVVVKAGLHSGEEVVVAGAYAIKARMQKSKIGQGHAH